MSTKEVEEVIFSKASRPCGPILKIVKDILPIFPFSPFFARSFSFVLVHVIEVIDPKQKQNILAPTSKKLLSYRLT